MTTKKTTKPAEGEVIETPEVPVAKDVTPEDVKALVAADAEAVKADVAGEKRLVAIAKGIRKEFGKGIDAQFAIGHLLNEARGLLPGDAEFGRWVAAQEFTFSRQTAYRLQQAALREPEVRAFIADSSVSQGKDIGPVTAIARLDSPSAEEKATAKRVQALVDDNEVPEPDAFMRFVKAAEDLDMSVLELGDLMELAGIIQRLAAAYKAEKARR